MGSRNGLVQDAQRRAKTLDEYISSHKCETGYMMSAFQHDKIDHIPVYELPRHLLRLNTNNGRFKAELDIIHAERKKHNKPIELDLESKEDSKIVQEMLRGVNPQSSERATAYKLLRDNISEIASKTNTNGQEYPGLITHDGVLINGNRRWVVMEDLASSSKGRQGEPLKYDKIRVGRLDQAVSRYDQWKNEAKEQISQESREEYDYVNSALEIKRGYELLLAKPGMDEKKATLELAKTLFGKSSKDVDDYLKFLETADMFLAEVDRPGEYRYIQESGSGESGITTILREVSAQLQKFHKQELPVDTIGKWFKAVSLFCQLSKTHPVGLSDDGKPKKLPFGARDYRHYHKIMEVKEIRENFLNSALLEKVDLRNPSAADSLEYHSGIQESLAEYDYQKGVNTPISLLKRARMALQKVSGALQTGAHKDEMLRSIKENRGDEYISDIQAMIREIDQKLRQ